MQQISESDQTLRLFRRVAKPSKNLQSLVRQLYPFLEKAHYPICIR